MVGKHQLIYRNPTDLYDQVLTEPPTINIFKTVYLKETRFSKTTVREEFNKPVKFGSTSVCRLSKCGDVLNRMGLAINLSKLCGPKMEKDENRVCGALCGCARCIYKLDDDCSPIYSWCNGIGNVLIKKIELKIGGTVISCSDGEWYDLINELTIKEEKKAGYYEMVGKVSSFSYTVNTFAKSMELIIPLDFFFNDIGSSLPVCAIDQDIEIFVKFKDFNSCWVCNYDNVEPPCAEISAYFVAEYAWLEPEMVRRYRKEPLYYLIEQTQRCDSKHIECGCTTFNFNFDFNFLVKELIWYVQRNDIIGPPDGTWDEDCSYPKGNDHFNYSNARIPRLSNRKDTVKSASLSIDGIDYIEEWPGWYYRLWNCYNCHTCIPVDNYIYCLPFCYDPESKQPNGTMNWSNIQKSTLKLNLRKEHYGFKVTLYARSYRIFSINSGLAGLMQFN